MHIQDLILLVVANEDEGDLQGRTVLQKKLYFLSELNGTDHCADLVFRPHYYGPYSSEVAENLDVLVNSGFLKEVTETFPTDRNVLGEIRRHTYSLTHDGKAIMDEVKQESTCGNWQRVLSELNNQTLANDFNTLSIAAKVHYIVNLQGRATRKQIKETAEGYGWDIDESEINNVLSFLEHLKLVSQK